MAGRTSINEVAAVSATNNVTMASGQTAATASAYGATSTASLTTATTTVSAIRDVSTASGRPSRRDQLNSTSVANTTTASAAGAVKPGIRSGVVTTAGSVVPPPTGQVTSRSYAGSPTGHYPPGPVNGYGRGNVPQSISSSAFTVGTSRYTR